VLTDKEIQQALHASRVVPLDVSSAHGPLGLEQLAAAVARLTTIPAADHVSRPICLRIATWEKLQELARAQQTQPVSAADIAVAIIEEFVGAACQTGGQ
jgi:hypothetical protein